MLSLLILLALSMILMQCGWEHNSMVNTSKIMASGNHLRGCWIFHQHPQDREFHLLAYLENLAAIFSDLLSNHMIPKFPDPYLLWGTLPHLMDSTWTSPTTTTCTWEVVYLYLQYTNDSIFCACCCVNDPKAEVPLWSSGPTLVAKFPRLHQDQWNSTCEQGDHIWCLLPDQNMQGKNNRLSWEGGSAAHFWKTKIAQPPPLEQGRNSSIDSVWQQRIGLIPCRASIWAPTGLIFVCDHEWEEVTPHNHAWLSKEPPVLLGVAFPCISKAWSRGECMLTTLASSGVTVYNPIRPRNTRKKQARGLILAGIRAAVGLVASRGAALPTMSQP